MVVTIKGRDGLAATAVSGAVGEEVAIQVLAGELTVVCAGGELTAEDAESAEEAETAAKRGSEPWATPPIIAGEGAFGAMELTTGAAKLGVPAGIPSELLPLIAGPAPGWLPVVLGNRSGRPEVAVPPVSADPCAMLAVPGPADAAPPPAVSLWPETSAS
jgi:hypothetical protein